MPIISSIQTPNGFDRADGIDSNRGTFTPSNAIRVRSANGATDVANIQLEEDVDSPTIERGEQATITHRFKMSWNEAKTQITFLGKGTLLADAENNITKVLSTMIQYQRGGYAIMTVVAESVSFDSPPDQFQIIPVELGVNITKHPRYFYAFLGAGAGSVTEQQNQMVIRLLQDYFENTNATYRDALIKMLSASTSTEAGVGSQPPVAKPKSETVAGVFTATDRVAGTALAKRAALEIIQKYWRNEETPYLIGYQITWSAFHFRPPYLNPGGYIENPMSGTAWPMAVPEYFISPAYPPSYSNTIFDYLDNINPQCYSADGTFGGGVNISWLRKADQMEEQRTWFKVDRTWIGSAVGFWDTDLYNNKERPTSPDHYRLTKIT